MGKRKFCNEPQSALDAVTRVYSRFKTLIRSKKGEIDSHFIVQKKFDLSTVDLELITVTTHQIVEATKFPDE